jgi:hypothetical protein
MNTLWRTWRLGLAGLVLLLAGTLSCVPLADHDGSWGDSGTVDQEDEVVTLAGTWSGTMIAQVRSIVSSDAPPSPDDPAAAQASLDIPFVITFAPDGTPDKLLVMVPPFDMHEAAAVEIAVLHAGETTTFEVAGSICTVVVQEATYAPEGMHVALSTSMSWQQTEYFHNGSSEKSGTVTTTQTLDAAPSVDGTMLAWSQPVAGTTQTEIVNRSSVYGVVYTGTRYGAQKIQVDGSLDRQP